MAINAIYGISIPAKRCHHFETRCTVDEEFAHRKPPPESNHQNNGRIRKTSAAVDSAKEGLAVTNTKNLGVYYLYVH